ncbi:TonB family protein [Pedobacter hiemivivus]|uniref:TonB family protein n=2 Tax=Pedobacter hiemivivus TaxID=2530454 RepID=A0A4U1G2Y2_9SPHI|nr:TonB family protein [Pedobacter hiemivivus]
MYYLTVVINLCMNKIFALFLSFMVIGLGVNAQKQNLYFLKNNGQYVKIRDSADYLRIVQEPDPGSVLYIVNEHYLDGSTKSKGLSSKIDPPVYEGQYISYYKNGKKKLLGNYSKGKLVDTVYNYYPNGNLYTEIAYVNAKDGVKTYIKTVKDSTGKNLVVNGNGACGLYDNNFKEIIESGSIKDGFYDGVWKGGLKRSGISYTETYVDGKLLSGESTDRSGNQYPYTKSHIQPEFKGGMKEFYKYLTKNVKYPQECYTQRIQGKVFLRFQVLKDGSISDIKVLRSPHPSLTREAIRVISVSPPWEPGVERGIPVNVFFNIPISFTVS